MFLRLSSCSSILPAFLLACAACGGATSAPSAQTGDAGAVDPVVVQPTVAWSTSFPMTPAYEDANVIPATPHANGLDIAADGSLRFATSFQGVATFGSAKIASAPMSNGELTLVKLTPNGELTTALPMGSALAASQNLLFPSDGTYAVIAGDGASIFSSRGVLADSRHVAPGSAGSVSLSGGAITADGGLLVGGCLQTSGEPDGSPFPTEGTSLPLVARLNAKGATLWTKTYPELVSAGTAGLCPTVTTGGGALLFTYVLPTKARGIGGALISADGGLVWHQDIAAASGFDAAVVAALDAKGNASVYVEGIGSMGSVKGDSATLYSFDAKGNERFTLHAGGDELATVRPTAITADADGVVYAAAGYYGDAIFGGTPLTHGRTGAWFSSPGASFVAKVDATGRVEWTKTVCEGAEDGCLVDKLAASDPGTLYLAGNHESPDPINVARRQPIRLFVEKWTE